LGLKEHFDSINSNYLNSNIKFINSNNQITNTMKKMFKQLLRATLLLAATSFVLSSCTKEDEPTAGPGLTGNSETYALNEAGDSGIEGTIKFEERTDNSTVVTIALTGAMGDHPAHIHANTAVEGGGIMLDLNIVDATGASVTEVTVLNDGTSVTYDQLIDFDGYVNVHKSEDDLGVLVAQGDIGQNVLTGEFEMFTLGAKSNPDISGTAKFEERKGGTTLVTINLANTAMGTEYPAHIHMGTAAVGGGIVISLTAVSGDTGLSYTNISTKDDDMAITYNDLVDFDGYINVHNPADLNMFMAQGDIGQNALTGTSVEYALNEVNMQGVTGTITFSERENGFTLVSIAVTGAGVVGDHAAHIHNNDVVTTGGIAITLNNVDASGVSLTSVAALGDGTEITYDGLTGFNGYAQIHGTGGTSLTNGNIGSN
jgi:hypothetical protein